MSDIRNQLIKDSYNYVLQSDLGTGVVYRIGGDVPVNPIFQSGLTINDRFVYANGTEGVGYTLITDGTGYAYWAPVSAATPSSGVTSVNTGFGLSGNVTTGAITIVNTAPDQTVTITGGTNIQVTGNYPNFGINYTGTTSVQGITGITGTSGVSSTTNDYGTTIINTAPDQTVTISGGTGITTGGTYPNFTLVNSLPDRTVTITGGTNIEITGNYPNFGVNYTGTTSVQGITGITGTSGVSATTNDYGTTIINTAPDQTVTITGGTNMQIVGTYPNFGVNFTGSTTGGTSVAYLPLSGGTLTGGLVVNSGLTANTISQTSYIDFTTGSTNPLQTGGRVFFDNVSKALSYYDVDNNLVPIAMGQQLYTRVYNGTGVQIDKGKIVTITGTTNGLPSIKLAVNNHSLQSPKPVGLAAENISNGGTGLILNNGILSGITLNTFANGDTLYLSDTVPGGYVSSTSLLSYTARTNEIGYVLQTGSTTGKIYVNINNEDSNLTLTDIERNILEGNVISSGAYEYTGMTQGTGNTINVALVRGWIVKNTYGFATLPDVVNLYYSGGTNIPLTYLNSADATYILITSASTLYQQTSFPTPQQRRENIFLSKVVHPNRSTITSINQTVDFDVSPMAALRDLWTPLKLINQGIIVSYYSAGTMSIQTSAGTLWGNGIGWTTNQLNPDSISISGTSPTTFQYRSRFGPITGSTGLPAAPTGNTTTIDSHHYDLNGSIVPVGGNNRATNQRIYLFPTGLIRIQYGQFSYSSMANAIAGIDTEIFVEYSNNRDNGILIGILTVREDASDLSLTTDAQFRFVSKFGELLAGAGGISTTTLQQAYDNSSTPEIVTNSAEGALTIKNGTGAADNVTNLLEGINSSNVTTSIIRADGAFSGTSIFGTGLTATTISATTYYNLPTDIRTTGATYSNNNFTFRNNTGGTYSVLFNTVTGLTVNGVLTVTGNTSLQGLTSTTISATTYYNLPQSTSGAGTTNYVSKWTGSTGLGDSQIYDDGTFVGVGKTFPNVPNSQFGVVSSIEVGSIQFTDRGNSIGITDTDLTSWKTGGNEIAIGYGGPLSNSQGNDNIAIGYSSLQSNISGTDNIAIGRGSLSFNETGQENVAIGHDAGSNITSGSFNIAIGYGSLIQTDVGSDNIAIGDQAGEANTNGNSNIYIGVKAAEINANGNNNTVIGSNANQAGSSDTSVFLGYNAGYNATSNNSVFIGPNAGYYESKNETLHIANTDTKTLIYGDFDKGYVGINTTSPTNALHVSASTNPLKLEGLQSSSETNYLVTDTSGVVSYTSVSPGGGISGSGTLNYIPKWTGSTGLGNSIIYSSGSSVGIGTTSPNASAILELSSTTQGVLFPRMTKAQRNLISSPPVGLIVYLTDTNEGLYIYKSTGWVQII
jgi:hypothetical protein